MKTAVETEKTEQDQVKLTSFDAPCTDDLDEEPPSSPEYVSSLELIYGKRGIPGNEVENLMGIKVDPPANTHPVRIIRDHVLQYPELLLDVFIAGDRHEEAMFAPMFARSKCQRAKSVLESDLVVFTGGADVDPQLYGEKCYNLTHYDTKRDSDDMALYMMCHEHGIPMLGICRGAQFLSVMNGGKLFQHVDGHYGDHPMYDLANKQMIATVSSVHHQMVLPNVTGGMEIIAISSGKSTKRVGPSPLITETMKAPDIEAFFYRDTCCLGIQGHPEYSGYNVFTKWSLELIKSYIADNTDVTWDTSNGPVHRRLDPTVIAERDKKLVTKKGAA